MFLRNNNPILWLEEGNDKWEVAGANLCDNDDFKEKTTNRKCGNRDS